MYLLTILIIILSVFQILKMQKLEQSDYDKGPRLMPIAKRGYPQQTKPIFRHEQQFDESSPYIKFGRNWVINDC